MKKIAAWLIVLSGVLAGQSIAAASDSEPSHFWGGVNLKYWVSTYTPSTGLDQGKSNELAPTFVVGYDKFFYTLSFGTQPTVTGSNYPAGGIKLQEESFGFGYNFNSNFALVLGNKAFAENYTGRTQNRTTYQTLAAVFNWEIPDSKAYLYGNIGMGSGKPQQSGTQMQEKFKYQGVELGLSYPIYPKTKASVGYKSEQLELPLGTVGSLGTVKKSGLLAGISYSF